MTHEEHIKCLVNVNDISGITPYRLDEILHAVVVRAAMPKTVLSIGARVGNRGVLALALSAESALERLAVNAGTVKSVVRGLILVLAPTVEPLS